LGNHELHSLNIIYRQEAAKGIAAHPGKEGRSWTVAAAAWGALHSTLIFLQKDYIFS